MKEQTQALEHASVKQYCKALRVPMIGAHFVQLAEQAIKEQHSHIGYLEALLTMESEERDRHAIQQRLRDAKLPRLKTLEERHRQDALGDWPVRGRMPAETASAIHYRCESCERTSGSAATQRGEASADTLAALRCDRT
jgi:IstB-like ATP binding protein